VHQMRVGLRRLRAAISLFAPLLRDPQTAAIKTELKWLARELAPARELDVLLQRVIMPVKRRHPRWHGIPSLSQEFAEKRKSALTRAQNAVASVRFHALTFETAAWLETGRWTKPRDDLARDRGDVAIEMFAVEQLTRRSRKVRKKAKGSRNSMPQVATGCASWQRSCAMRRSSLPACSRANNQRNGGTNSWRRSSVCSMVSAISTTLPCTRTSSPRWDSGADDWISSVPSPPGC
jgi:hypothetical protein